MTIDRRRLPALALILALALPAVAQEDDPGRYAGRDAEWWIGELKDDKTYPAAQIALKQIGRPALEPLSKALLSGDRRLRDRALSVLSGMRIDPSPVLSALIEAVDTTDLRFTARLLELVARSRRAAVPYIDTIAPLIETDHRTTVYRALEMLVRLKPESIRTLPRVLTLAKNGAPEFRRMAVYAAMRMAPDSEEMVAVLTTVLARAGDKERRDLLSSARHIRPATPGFADLVVRYADDSSAEVRSSVASLLKEVVLEDRTRLPVLIGMLGDKDPRVRSGAANSLAELETIATPAVAALTPLLTNDDPTDDLGAVKALTAIGPASAGAKPAVMALLERTDPSPGMLERALGRFLQVEPAWALEALESDRELPRRLGLRAIRSWNGDEWKRRLPGVLDAVEKVLLESTDPAGDGIQILVALRNHVAGDERATAMYLNLAKAPSARIRTMAAEQLALRPKCIPGLLELLGSEKPGDREFAFRAFMAHPSALRTEAAFKGLFALLSGDRAEVRDLAGLVLIHHFRAEGIDGLTPEDARAFARAAADRLDDEREAPRAVNRLGDMGKFALPYVDDLFALLGSEGPYLIGGSAAVALSQIANASEEASLRIVPRLEAALRGDDATAAASAANGLVYVGKHDAELVERLPALIRDPRPSVHFTAVRAAGGMAERGTALVPALLEVAGNPPEDSHVRWAAIQSLAAIAPTDERLLKICVASLSVQSYGGPHVGALAAGGETAARLLVDALEDADADLKFRILSILATLGPKASGVADRVRPFCDDRDRKVARLAEVILERLEQEAASRQKK